MFTPESHFTIYFMCLALWWYSSKEDTIYLTGPTNTHTGISSYEKHNHNNFKTCLSEYSIHINFFLKHFGDIFCWITRSLRTTGQDSLTSSSTVTLWIKEKPIDYCSWVISRLQEKWVVWHSILRHSTSTASSCQITYVQKKTWKPWHIALHLKSTFKNDIT